MAAANGGLKGTYSVSLLRKIETGDGANRFLRGCRATSYLAPAPSSVAGFVYPVLYGKFWEDRPELIVSPMLVATGDMLASIFARHSGIRIPAAQAHNCECKLCIFKLGSASRPRNESFAAMKSFHVFQLACLVFFSAAAMKTTVAWMPVRGA